MLAVKKFWDRLVDDVGTLLQSSGIPLQPLASETTGMFQSSSLDAVDPYLVRLVGRGGE